MLWALGLAVVVGAAIRYLLKRPPGVYQDPAENPNAVWRRQKPHHF